MKAVAANRSLDWISFSLYLCLVFVGWLMIFTVGYENGYELELTSFLATPVGKQSIWIILSFILFFLIFFIDWKFWQTFAYLIYALSLCLLILVLLVGVKIKGATSWFSLGGFTFQPSELAKLATCLALSSYLSSYGVSMKESKHQLIAFGLFLAPMILILLQPDAGSAFVFLSFLIMLYRAGLSPVFYVIGAFIATLFILALMFPPQNIILGTLLIAIVIFAFNSPKSKYHLVISAVLIGLAIYLSNLGWAKYVALGAIAPFLLYGFTLWNKRKQRLVLLLTLALIVGSALVFTANYIFNDILEKHQQERINVWLNPSEADARGPLYNLEQSKMAIGTGGLQGKGFLKGVMTKLDYVPEQSTDFIFCTIGEEQGFLGSFSIMALFLLLLYRLITIAERQRSNFSRFYCYGVAGIIFIHFFVNIGMTMGLVPVVGIPLPFISKGGSALLIFSIMIGLALKLDSNRYKI